MAISVTCSLCGKTGSVPDDFAGKSVQCPKCKSRIAVPALPIAVPSAPPQAPPAMLSPGPEIEPDEDEADELDEEREPLRQLPAAVPQMSGSREIVITGIQLPLMDAVGLIITFWAASVVLGAIAAIILGVLFFVFTRIVS